MKQISLFLIAAILVLQNLSAQVAINTTGADPDPSAILDISSTNKGVLIPRVTTAQRTSIGTSESGLLVYDTDTQSFWYYNGMTVSWSELGGEGSGASAIDDLSDAKADASSVFMGSNSGTSDDGSNHNTAVGLSSMTGVVSGTHNTALGHSALISNNAGGSNTAIGVSALGANQGSNNTAVGRNAGNGGGPSPAFSGCVMLGYQAGRDNTASNKLFIDNSSTSTPLIGGDFDENRVDINGTVKITGGNPGTGKVLHTDADGLAFWATPQTAATTIDGLEDAVTTTTDVFLGDDSGLNNNGSNFNTATGIQALSENTTGLNNAATGFGALQNNTTGYDNTANGFWAAQNTTTGYANTAVGKESLLKNTTRSNLTAVGYQALYWNGYGQSASTDATDNTAVGSKSLYANTTGYQNAALGSDALVSNTSGNGNTASGYSTLHDNTTGKQNTASGAYSLYKNTTAEGNSAFGYKSGYSITSGKYNSAFGLQALYSTTTGEYNSASGFGSLFQNQTGTENTASGYKALYSNVAGNENTAIGSRAGYNALGSGNVFIGRYAGYEEEGSNKLYIDNSSTANPLLFGDFAQNWINIGGKLAINTGTAPSNELEIGGDGLVLGSFEVEDNLTVGEDISLGDDITVGGEITYAAPKTKKLRLPAAAFSLSTNKDADKAQYNAYGEWTIEEFDGNGIMSIQAPVNLPHGAVVTRLSFFYRSFDGPFLSITFEAKHQFAVFDTDVIAGGNTAGQPSQWEITKVNYTSINASASTIDNNNVFYFVKVIFDQNGATSGPAFIKFYGAEIEYTTTKTD
ncbi:MAG: hypothetical protein PHQ65_09525 [Bacteroidales bacterium]|nr:hypothetical protein [Bacteroidales bacterium]MDD3665489.1 hypothetical protein [Bacteroidales bacterium]